MRQQAQTREAREAKLDAIHDQLAKSVAALVTGDDWRQALVRGKVPFTVSWQNVRIQNP